jgi:hypothetical protein
MHAYNNWNDAIGETLIDPLCLIMDFNPNAIYSAFELYLTWKSCYRV